MVGFKQVMTLPGDAAGFLTGVTGMTILAGANTPMLYLATGRGGGLSAYGIGSDGTLILSGTESYASNSAALTSVVLESILFRGKPVLLPVGPYDTSLTVYGLDGDGSLTGAKAGVLTVSPSMPHATSGMVSVSLGGLSCLYVAQTGIAAPTGYVVGASGLTSLPAAGGAGAPQDGTITALATLDGVPVLVAGMSGDDRILGYAIAADGTLSYAGTLGPESGLSIATPTDIAMTSLGGQTFAIVASAGSSSLTVIRVAADGTMAATDQVVDDLNTRFAAASQVATVTEGGHVFVLAAGSDDGLSLFALTPQGRLEHLVSLADSMATTLADISALAAVAQSSAIDVFAASGSESGLTALSVDLSKFGAILEGGSGGKITGTGLDDILVAHNGLDQLWGGGGADLFVFDPAGATADGKIGTVLDFVPGTDRLDLSALPMLHDASQIQVVTTAAGAELHFGDYWVEVDAATPGPLAASIFTTATILNADHVAVGLVDGFPFTVNDAPSTPQGVTLTGGAKADVLTGGDGSDLISGGAGNDTISGLGENDTLHGGDGGDSLLGGDGNDLIYGGDSALDGGDYIDGGAGNDTLDGGYGNDSISGGAGDDPLLGGAGNDWLDGGAGNDTLRGGDGADTILGGDGADLIYGGDSPADLRDVIYGGAGNDTIDAGYGNDSVSGDDGDDSINGSFGADTLIGNAGNDTLNGGPGADLLFGGPGDDFLNGGFGNDRMNGGPGADRFYHGGTPGEGSDWIQDYNAAGGDVLVFGDASAKASQFQVNFAETPNAGVAGTAEAFVIYKPTGQIIWALVDGAAQQHIELQISGSPVLHDLLA
ncbi:MAG: hypothetical protein GC186_00600 [Rhodobacteraceae bacterium]|nr:hypothetical protein [Paracoccaceae bacterium]